MPFAIKQNDLLPAFRVQVSGVGDLTGVVARFHMRRQTGTPALDKLATVEDGPRGILRYDWAAGDTAIAGLYNAEFQLAVDGGPLTVPTDGYFEVMVTAEVG